MGFVIFFLAVGAVLIGVPLYAVLGLSVMASILYLGDGFVIQVAADMFDAVNKEILLAIPFFVLAGQIMTEGALARRLIQVAKSSLGWLPGGLALSGILACVFFAAISGSSPVTLIAIGSMMYPSLTAEHYPKSFSVGLLSSSGTLGILIPPSIPMIVYSIVVRPKAGAISVVDLFIAGILPGLFIAAILVVFSMIRGRKTAGATPFNFNSCLKAYREGIFSLLLPVLVLGGIYLGFFTATEAAAVSVVYALLVELLIHRELRLRQIPGVFIESAVKMGSLFLIIVLAMSFNQFLAIEQVPQKATQFLSQVVENKVAFLLLTNLFLLLLGCFMDIISAILIVAPLLALTAETFGIHPIHFAIVFIVNMEIGYLTPPLGLNLFVASTVFKEPIGFVMKSALPFILLMILSLAFITYFEPLSLFLLRGG